MQRIEPAPFVLWMPVPPDGSIANKRRHMAAEEIQLKEGYIIDFISGEQVKATPEEKEAVQVFAHQLVEDYG